MLFYLQDGLIFLQLEGVGRGGGCIYLVNEKTKSGVTIENYESYRRAPAGKTSSSRVCLRSAIVSPANRNVQKYFENDEKVAEGPDRRRVKLA